MQEKPPFSSYLDFFSNVWEGDTHTHPLRTLVLYSGTPLDIHTVWCIVFISEFKLTFPALTGISALAYFVQNCVLSITRTQKNPENNVSIT